MVIGILFAINLVNATFLLIASHYSLLDKTSMGVALMFTTFTLGFSFGIVTHAWFLCVMLFKNEESYEEQ